MKKQEIEDDYSDGIEDEYVDPYSNAVDKFRSNNSKNSKILPDISQIRSNSNMID